MPIVADGKITPRNNDGKKKKETNDSPANSTIIEDIAFYYPEHQFLTKARKWAS